MLFASCLRKFKGLKEEHYFNEIAPQDTKMRMEVTFWSQESFVSLCFLDQGNFWPSKRTVYKDLQSSTSSDKEQEGIEERVNLG